MAVLKIVSLAVALAVQSSVLAADPTSSVAVDRAIRQFETKILKQRRAFEQMPPGAALAVNLQTRINLEQAMRAAISPALEPFAQADRSTADRAIWSRIEAVDTANTAYLKTVLPHDGWFRVRRDGEAISRNAWLIVQHSPDKRFQELIAKRMEPLVASGDAVGSQYALLYDRVEMFAGRPQLYGSQMACKDGRWQLATTKDPATLDQRRAKMGLPPIGEYLKNFGDPC